MCARHSERAIERQPFSVMRLPRLLLKAPVHIYRWTLRPLVGWRCRHMPTCSEYALEAIEKNGAWKGGWLTLARLVRCRPGGSSGYDPVPDLTTVREPLWRAWAYGRWRGPEQNAPPPPHG